MNLRQAQRSLADLISKCEAAHIRLPEDALEARAEAVEAIIHSLRNEKPNLNDAQEELLQKFGIQTEYQQRLESAQVKRQRQRRRQPLYTNTRGCPVAPSHDDGIDGEVRVSSTVTDSLTANSKRPVSSQDSSERASDEGTRTKKAKSSRTTDTVSESLVVTDEPVPPSSSCFQSSSTCQSDSISSGSPGNEMAYLLEDLDEAEGGDRVFLHVAAPLV
ncbi:unnamed protein product [Hyaloperonospora brassicae]|uniref:Uncharacterized protein n=1 Tax=Hyaloperonospora brassicae TaxID=162125 RepID=A0AAV0TTT4_HYABA|nr:unnamed protein product [Hyaloperonospora brassicae]